MANLIKEFKSFIYKGNAIDMAVGIIVGSVMTGLVNSLVSDVLMPPIGLLIGGVDFSGLFIILAGGEPGAHYATVAAANAAGATTMNLGNLLNAFVSFLITMFAIFLFVKIVNKTRDKAAVTTRTCPYCQSTISMSATKCPYCCSALKAETVKAAEESDLKRGIKNLTKAAKGTISKITVKSKK
ncbi:MAG: large conductance mechanosensitive channel protein MscL [Proteobacteria bacterium]|nr:large conductance mechanosensitive channel protein MscL [Candidatus Enterousia scatequi]